MAGAVLVTTPSTVAMEDAAKALNMFAKLQVPVLGMIENMSFFVCPKCEKVFRWDEARTDGPKANDESRSDGKRGNR